MALNPPVEVLDSLDEQISDLEFSLEAKLERIERPTEKKRRLISTLLQKKRPKLGLRNSLLKPILKLSVVGRRLISTSETVSKTY